MIFVMIKENFKENVELFDAKIQVQILKKIFLKN